MTERHGADVDAFAKLIGFDFADRKRLALALTHASARSGKDDNYERLEFLGDRVLGLVIAENLFRLFPGASEGELSVRLNQLVSAEACARVADDLGLHRFIKTGQDVKKLTGKRVLSIRADVVESVIAALYLEGGLKPAREFIETWWKPLFADGVTLRRDAKTELQEWAHARFGQTPVYKVEDRSGPDHEPRFTVTVTVSGVAPETGIDRSKRAAEQVAATRLLEREGVWTAES
ncbi:ribonuclease III [Martelella mediterranea]|uniref:ribonuclease III n=1 Tax=Martelella mediterranea TaxID=293089 RepID=UPI001E327A1A|nr:ribonuclease III [Martelella mediterranea]MCD1634521.1 ribonuclease III [Martelella mediterranea]